MRRLPSPLAGTLSGAPPVGDRVRLRLPSLLARALRVCRRRAVERTRAPEDAPGAHVVSDCRTLERDLPCRRSPGGQPRATAPSTFETCGGMPRMVWLVSCCARRRGKEKGSLPLLGLEPSGSGSMCIYIYIYWRPHPPYLSAVCRYPHCQCLHISITMIIIITICQ